MQNTFSLMNKLNTFLISSIQELLKLLSVVIAFIEPGLIKGKNILLSLKSIKIECNRMTNLFLILLALLLAIPTYN